MTVPGRDDVIVDHVDGGLVVFADDGRCSGRETNFGEKTTEPEDVLDTFVGRNKFSFRCTLTNHCSRFGGPDDGAAGEHDDVTAPGAMTQVVTVTRVDESRDVEGALTDGILETEVARVKQILQDTKGGSPVGHGGIRAVCAGKTYGSLNIRTSNANPEEAADEGEVRLGRDVQRFGVSRGRTVETAGGVAWGVHGRALSESISFRELVDVVLLVKKNAGGRDGNLDSNHEFWDTEVGHFVGGRHMLREIVHHASGRSGVQHIVDHNCHDSEVGVGNLEPYTWVRFRLNVAEFCNRA